MTPAWAIITVTTGDGAKSDDLTASILDSPRPAHISPTVGRMKILGRIAVLILATLIALAIAACSGPSTIVPPSAPATSGEPGSGPATATITSRSSGISFTVPAGWESIDLARAATRPVDELPAGFHRLAQQHMRSSEEHFAQLDREVEVVAVGGDSDALLTSNIDIRPFTMAELPSDETIRAAITKGGAATADSIERTRASVGEVLTAVITYGSSGSFQIHASSIMVLTGNHPITGAAITVTTADADETAALTSGILESLTLVTPESAQATEHP